MLARLKTFIGYVRDRLFEHNSLIAISAAIYAAAAISPPDKYYGLAFALVSILIPNGSLKQ
jgi:hypothetical protein